MTNSDFKDDAVYKMKFESYLLIKKNLVELSKRYNDLTENLLKDPKDKDFIAEYNHIMQYYDSLCASFDMIRPLTRELCIYSYHFNKSRFSSLERQRAEERISIILKERKEDEEANPNKVAVFDDLTDYTLFYEDKEKCVKV